MLNKPLLGLALMPEPDFLKASLDLFKKGDVDVLEWSFDTFFDKTNLPVWIKELLMFYGKKDRLLGHGVYYSILDASWSPRQELWLAQLENEVKTHNYAHISEHFGFTTSDNFHKAVPLPIPLSKASLNIGVDRLKRLQDAVSVPVGLENLAFSFSKKDVLEQGIFLDKLVSSVNGFILLDLHNIYCQAHNFGLEMIDLIRLYPLDKVKEIHVSGGSWQEKPDGQRIRRDTHDGNIPNEIFNALPKVLELCQNTQSVIFERLGNTFYTDQDVVNFQKDFYQLKEIIEKTNLESSTQSWRKISHPKYNPLIDSSLLKDQQKLVNHLKSSKNANSVKHIRFENWDSSSWDDDMICTAIEITKKWNFVRSDKN